MFTIDTFVGYKNQPSPLMWHIQLVDTPIATAANQNINIAKMQQMMICLCLALVASAAAKAALPVAAPFAGPFAAGPYAAAPFAAAPFAAAPFAAAPFAAAPFAAYTVPAPAPFAAPLAISSSQRLDFFNQFNAAFAPPARLVATPAGVAAVPAFPGPARFVQPSRFIAPAAGQFFF